MRLATFPTAAAFAQAAEPWLADAERANNLILTVLKSTVRRADLSFGWLVMDGARPLLALFRVPPHYVLVSEGSVEAAEWTAEIAEPELPGTFGPAAVTDAFVATWSRRADRAAHLNAEMTFYTLARVESVALPGGRLRQAAPEEFDLLAPLACAAARDMNLPLEEQNPAVIEKGLRRAIAEGKQFVWAEGPSVRAMAAYVNSLDHAGARIRGVYTPPEFRGKGYGSAVTGALAEFLLRTGQEWVGLFADNANPTSTGIYRRLGFSPEGVFRSWRFERIPLGSGPGIV